MSAALQAFTAQDRANSLQVAARRVETALLALEAFDARAALGRADAPRSGDEREALLRVAADCVWAYLVQRELNGSAFDTDTLLDEFHVPDDVRRRIGVSAPRGASR